MKKIIVLTTVLMSTFVTAFSSNLKSRNVNTTETRYGYAEPFKFNERGVVFYIFPNGEFDFNTHPNHHRTRRSNINTTYGAPGRRYGHYYHNTNTGVRIEHDHLGRVRRIGHVFINYDHLGRVKRVGSVYMRYRNRLLKQIGGLRITYNRYGHIINTMGFIKRNNCQLCGVISCGINHTSNSHPFSYDDGGYDDNEYYYYRNKKGKTKNIKR